MGKNQHIIPYKSKWGIKAAGDSEYSFIFNTKEECIEKAVLLAKEQCSKVVVHSKDGKIVATESFINESPPKKGRFDIGSG